MPDRDPVIDQIKEKLDILDLVRDACILTQDGDEWRGAHNKHSSESGESLSVNPKKQAWHCFNCGASGDVLSWIADQHNLDIKVNFGQVLEIAAEKAGVQLQGQDMAAWSELNEIRTLYTAAAERYHSNLSDAHREFIHKQWGLTDKTIDDLKIGMAKTTGTALQEEFKNLFARDLIEKSGLVIRTSRGWLDTFQGRIIFPYWLNGQVVYFIGRQSEWTPKTEYESMKYKKLVTRSKNHDYVSEHIGNRYFYGEDSVRSAKNFFVITEGVTDCISLLQEGIPSISPVTVRFRKQDHDRLLKLAKLVEMVYICNDTDEAGIKGAIDTAEFLDTHGVDVKIVQLPRDDMNE